MSGKILEQNISSVLSKGAIRAVPAAESQLCFYVLYFLVPKKGLEQCPIFDLQVLNGSEKKSYFQMLTHNVLSRSIRQCDWFTNVDLQDAYFHISILPAHGEVSQVCLSRYSQQIPPQKNIYTHFKIPCCSHRASLSSLYVQQVWEGGSRTPESFLHRQLPALFT